MDAREISAALQMAQPRERSYLLAQVLQQMNQPRQNPQSYGSLAAQLGAQFLDKGTADREASAMQQQQQAQSQALAQALQQFQQQSQGGMQTLPGTGVQLGDVNSPVGGSPADPAGARAGLMGHAIQNQHPMAQGIAQQLMGQMLAPPPEPEKIDVGDRIIFKQGDKIVGELPKNPTPDASMRERGDESRFSRGEENEMFRHLSSQEGMNRRFAIGESNENKRAEMSAGRRDFKDTQSVRKEFEGLDSVKNYKTALPKIEAAANAPDNGFGDLQLIYAVGKLLDPQSVVREGELALTIAANSPLQRIIGQTRFTTEKGGRLTPQAREQIMGMLGEVVGSYKAAYDQDYERFSDYASQMGTDPEQVVGKRADAAFKDKSVPQIQSDAEFAKLPSGAVFIGPDGKKRKKP